MRILLDECVPWPLHKFLPTHECTTAQRAGWGGIKNGELLDRAEGEYDLFVTSDQNIRYQQNLKGRRIPILKLSTNDYAASLPQLNWYYRLSRKSNRVNSFTWKSLEQHLDDRRLNQR